MGPRGADGASREDTQSTAEPLFLPEQKRARLEVEEKASSSGDNAGAMEGTPSDGEEGGTKRNPETPNTHRDMEQRHVRNVFDCL